MAFNAQKAGNTSAGNKVEQAAIEPGLYPARLVQLIDLGLQPQRAFQGTPKPPMQEIMLTYELVDVFMVDEEGNEQEDKPRWVSETIPFHNLRAEKAKSTQRYLAFDPKQDWGGDFTQAVGQPINVVLVQKSVGDKVYTNIASCAAMRPRDAANCAELKNPTKVFSLDEPDVEMFNTIPKWIRENIQKNLNYSGSALEAALKGKPVAKAAKKEAPVEEEQDDSDSPY